MNHFMDESQCSSIRLSYFLLNVCPVFKLNLGRFSTLFIHHVCDFAGMFEGAKVTISFKRFKTLMVNVPSQEPEKVRI